MSIENILAEYKEFVNSTEDRWLKAYYLVEIERLKKFIKENKGFSKS